MYIRANMYTLYTHIPNTSQYISRYIVQPSAFQLPGLWPLQEDLTTVHISSWEQRLDWRSFLSEAALSPQFQQGSYSCWF